METPSLIRTKKCGLPPLLLFYPGSTPKSSAHVPSAATDNVESDEETSQLEQIQIWNRQMKEQEFINTAMRRIRWILVRLQAHITSLDIDSDFQVFCSGNGLTNEPVLTVFDLNQVALKLEMLRVQVDSFSKYLEELAPTCVEPDDTKFIGYWIERIRESNGWENMLNFPLEDAASDILVLYGRGSDDSQNGAVGNYLQYQAAQTLRQVQHVSLPSLKQKLERKQNHLHKMQASQKELANRHNTAFEQLDDYCMNVLRIESDTLPLLPESGAIIGDTAMIDAHAKDIGNCVIQPMRNEFHALSDRFVRLLTGWSEESDGKFTHYRKDVSQAIIYYRHFAKFVLNEEHAPGDTDDAPLNTLYQFTTGSSDSDKHHGESCLSQFIISQLTRVQLVNDLQQLDSFLSCRMRELAGVTPRGFGHAIAEAIDLEWMQFCIKQEVDPTSDQLPILVGINSEEITRFQQSSHDVLMQIVGDGTNAKRLRLLADAVGYESASTEPFSFHFHLLCLKAANLLRQLTLLDDQSKTLSRAIEEIERSIGQTEKEVGVIENRIRCIYKGLSANPS